MFFLMVLGAIESAQQERKVDAAQELRIGMTEEEVIDIMGPPDIDYRPQWNHWCYGMSIDVNDMISADGRANFVPVRLRLFSYGDDDVVVRWNDAGKVGFVNRPQTLAVPERFRELRDVFVFVRDVFDLITDQP